MKILAFRITWAIAAAASIGAAVLPSTAGIEALVRRRLPQHARNFEFALVDVAPLRQTSTRYDSYNVTSTRNGKIRVEGTTLSALATGLHRYLADEALVDVNWFIGSQLHHAPTPLPPLTSPTLGASVVPLRYYFNTVTFSYTSVFWSWEDWELELDWLALRGVNLALAWNGYEKILLDIYREIGLSDSEILDFLSGPAFQSWNRLGNIQGAWGGDQVPLEWIDRQWELQKKIVARMVELGITPVLPAFTGFVPAALRTKFPDTTLVQGAQWLWFSPEHTRDTFLEPSEPMFQELQARVIKQQQDALGNVTHFYALDQFNEIHPSLDDNESLHRTAHYTWKSLKAADPDAVWVAQGWLFASDPIFWTNEKVEAYLSGVKRDEDMIILDLFSETLPQWERLDSYYGKPWIWCQLHNFGGNMGLYGQVDNVTIDATAALSQSKSMVGMGLTMEGQEGNEIMYNLLLEQAWSSEPIDTALYFHNWAVSRYSAGGRFALPQSIGRAWEILRGSVYNNTNFDVAQATTKSIFELSPAVSGLTDRTGHHPTTIPYDERSLITAWWYMIYATHEEPDLWNNVAFTFDLADMTRQILGNAFTTLYTDFLDAVLPQPLAHAHEAGAKLNRLLALLERVLAAAHPSFHLQTWLDAAAASAVDDSEARTLLYDARNQVTMWGADGELADYASKSWAGLVGGYYLPRWQMFVDAYVAGDVSEEDLAADLKNFTSQWQHQLARTSPTPATASPVSSTTRAPFAFFGSLQDVMAQPDPRSAVSTDSLHDAIVDVLEQWDDLIVLKPEHVIR